MNTFRFSIGIHSLREARMLRMSPALPENVPPQELPPGDIHVDLRADQATPEMLQQLSDNVLGRQQQTNETVESEIARLIETAQRDVDAIAATPGMSRQFITDYLKDMNAGLHPRKLHMSMANGQIRVSPHNPTVFPPEVIARKNRINELQGQINEVDRNIQMLRRDFSQNAMQYRNQKGAAMNRGNIAPEVNRFLMQFPQASMQASAGPLNQLYSLKFQLQQELAGVKSGRIKVPVPGPGEDPSLINDPRFAASALGDTRFNLSGAPGGIGPDGLPLENALPTAAEQAQILRYTARWRNAKTEEERETVEGFLMMDGVDVDGSNLENDEIVMVSPDERGIQFLVGLITVLKSFIDRLGRKRTAIEGADVSDRDPSTMTQEERDAETETNNGKIKDLKEKREKTAGEIATTEKKLKDTAAPLEGEAKEKAEKELKAMKEELAMIDEEIKKLEDRNAVLADPSTFKKKEEQDETGLVTQDKLQEDPVFQDFLIAKEQAKQKLHTALKQVLNSGDIQKNMERLGEAFDIDMSDVDWKENGKAAAEEFVAFMDSFFDNSALEKNGAGKYRMVMDAVKPFESILRNPLLAELQKELRENLPRFTKEIGAELELDLTASEDKVMTAFMDGQTLLRRMF